MNVARSFRSMTKSFLTGRTQAFRVSMNRDTPAATCFHSLESYSSRLVPRGCAPPTSWNWMERLKSPASAYAAAQTILLAAGVGLVGGSIEDARVDREKAIYDIALATERVAASVEASRSLPFPFTLAARAENFVRGNPNLDDTIKRLIAYEKAGADVLFAPGLPDLASVRAVCSAVSKPVNFAVGGRGRSFSVAELADAGVKRISFAASFYRAAMTGLADAAQEARNNGTFTFVDRVMTTPELNRFFPE